MSMARYVPKFRGLVAAAALSLLLIPPSAAYASDLATDQWSSVIALEDGQSVRVHTSESRVSGRIVSADAEMLTLAVSRQSVRIPRRSVLRVLTVGGRAIGRDAGRGLLIGAAGGAVWWAIVSRNRAAGALAGGIFGAIDGALVGALVGIGDRPERLVYEDPSLRGDRTAASSQPNAHLDHVADAVDARSSEIPVDAE